MPNAPYSKRYLQAKKMTTNSIEKQKKATKYYDRFAKIYDLVSSKSYYSKPREFAIKEMNLNENQNILNIPCGTGQNFEGFQKYLKNTGKVIGIDLSSGMLEKAKDKIKKNKWNNIQIINGNATEINAEWIKKEFKSDLKFDAIFCDLGLSRFPKWENVINNLISLLKPNGKIVIMDWYIEKRNFRGMFIKWIGKGEVNRPIWQNSLERLKSGNANFVTDKLNNDLRDSSRRKSVIDGQNPFAVVLTCSDSRIVPKILPTLRQLRA